MANPLGIGGVKKGDPSRNPTGREPMTAAQKEARQMLKAATPRAAQVVIDLMESDDEKISIAAAKIVIDKEVPDKLDGESLRAESPFTGMTATQLLELVKAARAK